MLERTYGASLLIRQQDSTPKFRLVQSLLNCPHRILAFDRFQVERIGDESQAFIEGEHESPVGHIVGHDVYRKNGHENARSNSPQQDDRKS